MRTGGDIYPARDPHRVPLGLLRRERVLSSDGETFYTVTQRADGTWACECLGYLHQARADGQCRHIDQVRSEAASLV